MAAKYTLFNSFLQCLFFGFLFQFAISAQGNNDAYCQYESYEDGYFYHYKLVYYCLYVRFWLKFNQF